MMLDKLSQNKSETWSLLGAFLVILGTFLPWYNIESTWQIPWAGVQLEGTVYGYSLLFGQIYLLITAIFTTLTLIPVKEKNKPRVFCGRTFSGALIIILSITNVLAPIYRTAATAPGPRIGILPILIGCIFLSYGLKKGYENLD
ncbi:MAG: hypothetical protein ACLFUR_05850 [Candidatus Hadarchaeia archaeon]